MNQRAASTQERILTEAEQLILGQGFANTSIDEIVDAAAITKSGFFYHYPGKTDLARALVQRFLKKDADIFDALLERADSLTDDPLQQLLIFLKLFSELMESLEETHPGCLVVTFTYESHLLEPEIVELVRQGVLSWETMIRERLERIGSRYTPRADLNPTALANMFTATVEGGIVLSRLFQTNRHLVEQILLYRQHLQMLFSPA